MKLIEETCLNFTNRLAAREPVPGGGGAAALIGALAAALCSMAGNYSTDKKSAEGHEEELRAAIDKAEELRMRLLALVDADAEAFAPLARAYGIPKDAPGRAAVMEEALRTACSVPMDIMRACGEALDIIEEFAAKGSKIAISDAGCGAILCKAAMQAASLNIFINTKSMKDRACAAALEEEANALLAKYTALGDAVFAAVTDRIRG